MLLTYLANKKLVEKAIEFSKSNVVEYKPTANVEYQETMGKMISEIRHGFENDTPIVLASIEKDDNGRIDNTRLLTKCSELELAEVFCVIFQHLEDRGVRKSVLKTLILQMKGDTKENG